MLSLRKDVRGDCLPLIRDDWIATGDHGMGYDLHLGDIEACSAQRAGRAIHPGIWAA